MTDEGIDLRKWLDDYEWRESWRHRHADERAQCLRRHSWPADEVKKAAQESRRPGRSVSEIYYSDLVRAALRMELRI